MSDNNFEPPNNQWNGDSDTQERLATFLQSDLWATICDDAEHDADSLDVMEDFSVRVASLVFFLERNILDRAAREEQGILKLINIYES